MKNTIAEVNVKKSGVFVIGEQKVERVVYDQNGSEIEREVSIVVEVAELQEVQNEKQ